MEPRITFPLPLGGPNHGEHNLDLHIPISTQSRIRAAMRQAVRHEIRCAICHDSFSEADITSTRCYHHFHAECFRSLVDHRLREESEIRSIDCPHCRRRCRSTYGISEDPRNGPIWRKPILEDFPDNYSS